MKFLRKVFTAILQPGIFLFFLHGQALIAQNNDLNLQALQFFRQSLAKNLKLHPQNLRLYPGTAVIGAQSRWLWNLFNAIPPKDSLFYDPVQAHNFSEAYGQLLFQVKTSPITDSCDKNAAILKYYDALKLGCIWNKTIGELQESLVNGEMLKFDTDTVISGIDPKTELVWSDTILTGLHFDKVSVFYAQPYSVKDTINPILNEYLPWYLPCFIRKVYANLRESYLTAKEWEYFFGKSGVIHSQTVAIIVAYKGFTYMSVKSEFSKLYTLTTFDEPVILGVVVYPFREVVK